jgi:hypothetical protein
LRLSVRLTGTIVWCRVSIVQTGSFWMLQR